MNVTEIRAEAARRCAAAFIKLVSLDRRFCEEQDRAIRDVVSQAYGVAWTAGDNARDDARQFSVERDWFLRLIHESDRRGEAINKAVAADPSRVFRAFFCAQRLGLLRDAGSPRQFALAAATAAGLDPVEAAKRANSI